jgi:DNA-binding transcriptional LysR family regulator
MRKRRMSGNIVDREWLPPLAGHARIAVRTNGREPMATMAAAGIGMACLPHILGDATAGLRRLATPTPAPERKLWMGVHRAARRARPRGCAPPARF